MAPQPPDSLVIVAIIALLIGILSPLFVPREVMDWLAGIGILFIAVVLVFAFFRGRRKKPTE